MQISVNLCKQKSFGATLTAVGLRTFVHGLTAADVGSVTFCLQGLCFASDRSWISFLCPSNPDTLTTSGKWLAMVGLGECLISVVPLGAMPIWQCSIHLLNWSTGLLRTTCQFWNFDLGSVLIPLCMQPLALWTVSEVACTRGLTFLAASGDFCRGDSYWNHLDKSRYRQAED